MKAYGGVELQIHNLSASTAQKIREEKGETPFFVGEQCKTLIFDVPKHHVVGAYRR
jgi:hypothetical protein